MASFRIRWLLSTGLSITVISSAVYCGADVVRDYLQAPIQTVRIEGDLSPEERAAVRTAVGQAVANVSSSPREVLKAIVTLGWARNVEVRRVWPLTFDISVTRETLAAQWGDSGYLTTSGRVVDAPDSQDVNLPRLRGAVSDGPRTMQIYRSLSEQLVDTRFTLRTLRENELGEWHVEFDGGLEVCLGSEDLVQRLRRFLVVYQNALREDDRTIEHVDARYRSGIAVRWESDVEPMTLASNMGAGHGN